MKAYLVRHAQAFPSSEDPEGHLTPQGEKTAREVGKFLKNHSKAEITHYYHSHKTRAKETAKLIAAQLNLPSPITEVDGLQPMDKPIVWKNNLNTIEKDVMVVSHLPYLNNLARILLEPAGNFVDINFRNGTCLCIERYASEHWVIDYEFSP
jgi:phosphohistidine phosphatase